MDSNLLHHHHYSQQQQQNNDNGTNYSGPGLTRYRSAPSSYFTNFVSRDFSPVDFPNHPSSPETERILEHLISGSGGTKSTGRAGLSGNDGDRDGKFRMTKKREGRGQDFAGQGNYSPVSQGMDMEYRVSGGGVEADRFVPVKFGNGSNLIRRSSSPAGLFDDINIDAKSVTSFNNTMKVSPIPEVGKKNLLEVSTGSTTHDEVVDFGKHGGSNYLAEFPFGSMDEIMNPENLFSGGRRGGDDDDSAFSSLIAEDGEEDARRRFRPLSHHLSLPRASAEISAMESFLQLQDSVPCKTRAKRGCATHPRSIAERVRRTKISERIRKLQDLVPNMDKQTNTADMLDLAVDYIKDLQKQVQKEKRVEQNEFQQTKVGNRDMVLNDDDSPSTVR